LFAKKKIYIFNLGGLVIFVRDKVVLTCYLHVSLAPKEIFLTFSKLF